MRAPQIDRLHLASLTAPAGHPSAGAAIEVFAYLVRRGDLTVLVDTGMGGDSAFLDKLYAARRTDLSTPLAAVGASVADIDAVVNSHLHFDHCGGNRLFPGMPIYVQARERQAARTARYTVESWVEPEGVTIREVDGDHEIAPGLTLLFTPGHQSLLVETPDGPLIVGAQAAYTAAEFEAGGDLAEAHEGMGEAYRASIERLKSLAPTRVFFSHDRREWPG